MPKKHGIPRSTIGRFFSIAEKGDQFIVYNTSKQNVLSTARFYGKKIKTEKIIFLDAKKLTIIEAYKITLLSGNI